VGGIGCHQADDHSGDAATHWDEVNVHQGAFLQRDLSARLANTELAGVVNCLGNVIFLARDDLFSHQRSAFGRNP